MQRRMLWWNVATAMSLTLFGVAADAEEVAAITAKDATSDPLMFLLRAPAVRRELGISGPQLASLEHVISDVNDPLWQLRDAQFLSAENSARAWQLIRQAERRCSEVLQHEQQARFRQLVIQSRGVDGLLSPDVSESLRLSDEQRKRIAAAFDETARETQRLRKEAVGKPDSHLPQDIEKLRAAQQKKLVAVLSDEQKRRFLSMAGKPFDLATIPRRFARAPEIRGIEKWINTEPLQLSNLRGKVVALHFFTYGCINCIHNQPAYKDWHERFGDRGAVVLGIHTPETTSEKQVENVRNAVVKQALKYPVAIDGKKENWTVWANHIWPSVYLIDKSGYVRYWWYGELNWQGAQGEKLFRTKIGDLLSEKADGEHGI